MSDSKNKLAAPVAGGAALAYKFRPPLPPPHSIQRPRLLSGTLGANRYSAVVIQGPAGHGKTTLLQQILQRAKDAGTETGWLTLDMRDNDVSRFNTSLTTLVNTAVKIHPTNIAPLPYGNGAVDHLLQLLDGAGGPVSLFLDEFQTLSEPVNIALFDTLLERCPPNVTFYLGSRSVPDLARGRLMISGRVKWITPEEICFTAEEVQVFLTLVGLHVSKAEANAFRESTGGWPAVLQLVQLALKGKRIGRSTLLSWISGFQSELRDYLADNIMSDLPDRKRRFLLRTSLLNRLSAPLCQAITGESNAQQLLEELVVEGLFVRPLDVEQHWFTYHLIFSSYLNAQIESETPQDIQSIHRQAALWYRDNNYPEETIHHAINAGDLDLAADTLEIWAPQLICSARLQTMENLCELLPKAQISMRPMLAWGRTWALEFLNRKDKAGLALNEFEDIVCSLPNSITLSKSLKILKGVDALINDKFGESMAWLEKIPIETRKQSITSFFEMGALANLKTIQCLYQGRFTEAREFALIGESLGYQGEAAFSGAYSTSLVALTMILSGELKLALKQLTDEYNRKEMIVQGSLVFAPLSTVYGFALYESGNFVAAESLLSDNIDSISQTLPVDWLILAYLVLARASAQSDRSHADCIEVLDNGERLGLISRLPRLVRAMRRERIRIALLDNSCQDISLLLDMPGAATDGNLPDSWIYFSEDCNDDKICTIRLAIGSEEPELAQALLESAIAAAGTTGRVRRKIKLMILQSLLHLTSMEKMLAQQVLAATIELAMDQDYISTFVDEGPQCLELLAELLKNTQANSAASFIRRILVAGGYNISPLGDNDKPCALIENLTKKEQAIVKLLTSGASNVEIADQLYVSRNTVKFHLKNIYAKLGAKNRTQVTNIARRLLLV
ncbi:MAG: helix-turn-helix transcriptional regulator [Gammaproteobacteria bacterium]|nr:MAG: helix-turn-helix transcriptional regulator [Gammaproteobacteria bacterium]